MPIGSYRRDATIELTRGVRQNEYGDKEGKVSRTAILTLSDNKNAPEAIVPVPLASGIRRAGMLYREFWRQGDVAIYCAKGKGQRIEYEVFKVQVLPAGELGGRSYPVRESFPPNSDWGSLEFTYTNNSHRDPLAAALAKARQIASRRARATPMDFASEQEGAVC
jgi:hypothetical protein